MSSPYWLVNGIFGGGIDFGVCSQEQLLQAIQLLQYSSNNPEASSSTTTAYPVVEVHHSVPCWESLLASELEKQRLEMDLLMQLENQELREAVQERAREQAFLLKSRIINLIHQKEEDLEIKRKKNRELQNLLVMAEMKVQAWQKKAMENEAIVLHLINRLNLSSIHHIDDDAEESATDPSIQVKKMACKLCNSRRQCIVFLPCRHLCSCRPCESLLPICPVCESVKQSSMEVFLD